MSTQGSGASPRRWHGVHKALAEPLRIRLLEALWEMPQSAHELADHVDLPPDRLYYHLNHLERAGLIEIAEYRPLARGKVERVYTPAWHLRPPPERQHDRSSLQRNRRPYT
ncbi:ArsR/SmtB family transcription factor [Streptomyces olivochromogenes]|uniref:ArsR/SmtB family transcription factor n=1 Tax=Streptomyces olivochromogenes TaxID=1963 RepID=UPI0036DC3063